MGRSFSAHIAHLELLITSHKTNNTIHITDLAACSLGSLVLSLGVAREAQGKMKELHSARSSKHQPYV
jgi:hypothetical protein